MSNTCSESDEYQADFLSPSKENSITRIDLFYSNVFEDQQSGAGYGSSFSVARVAFDFLVILSHSSSSPEMSVASSDEPISPLVPTSHTGSIEVRSALSHRVHSR